MIYRPKDDKLGYLLYKTEKDAWLRGVKPKNSEWIVVEVETEVKGDVADRDEVSVVAEKRRGVGAKFRSII